MYNYLLLQKWWSLLIFPDQSKALGGAIASSVGGSEAPKVLRESNRSLRQGNLATVSDILNNPKKLFFPDYRGFPVTANENGHRIWILHSNTLPWIKKGE